MWRDFDGLRQDWRHILNCRKRQQKFDFDSADRLRDRVVNERQNSARKEANARIDERQKDR